MASTLSATPPTPRPSRVMSRTATPLVAVATLTVLVTVAVVPFSQHRLQPSVSFVPAMVAVVACFDILSIYLLVATYRDNGNVRILVMSCAYLWSMVAMTGYALAFPGGVAVDPPLAVTPSTAPYLYIAWHGGFPILLAAAWAPWPARWRGATPLSHRRHVTMAVTAAATVGSVLVVSMYLVLADRLPVLIEGLDTSRMTSVTAPVTLPLVVLSLVVVLRGTRRLTGPERWTGVVVLVCLCDLVLTYHARHRYSLGWYSGRTLTIVAAAVVLIAMLATLRRLKARAELDTTTKSAFLATMSHEIRTPMNAVIGMTSLLLDTPLTSQQRELAETARDSGESLLVIINDILDFSKIEAGELDLEQHQFELRGCVESALHVMGLAADAKGVELVADLDETCPALVVGDVTRFRQVVVNLLGNAVKFTSSGEVVVEVSAETLTDQPDGPVRLTVAVTDTGIGIPADRLGRLFHAFSQVDASTTRVYGGTGLGLVISRRLAEAMGGRLEVVSQVGVGSTFTFVAVLRGFPEGQVAGVPSAAPVTGSRVLVVEDNASRRRVLRRQLDGWGLVCTAVATPTSALELLAAGAVVDVAILDVGAVDGGRLTPELRELLAALPVPVIALAGLHWRPTSAVREHFHAVVTKPIKSGLLLGSLVAVVAPGEPAASQGGSVDTGPGDHQTTLSARLPALRVLLAEDNPVNQRVGQLILAKLGCEVETVGDGLAAVLAVRDGTYDVVLMDVQMPLLDGLAATKRIRAEQPPDRQPAIVAMTAGALVEDRAACLAAGMTFFLTKPIRQQELAQVFAQVQRRDDVSTFETLPVGG